MEDKKEKKAKPSAASALTKEEPSAEKKETAKKDGKAAKKEGSKKHKFSHTHIEHHSNGSHTVRHTPAAGGDDVSYAAPDLQGVQSGLQQNIGGGPEAQAAPEAEPAAPAAPAAPQAMPAGQ